MTPLSCSVPYLSVPKLSFTKPVVSQFTPCSCSVTPLLLMVWSASLFDLAEKSISNCSCVLTSSIFSKVPDTRKGAVWLDAPPDVTMTFSVTVPSYRTSCTLCRYVYVCERYAVRVVCCASFTSTAAVGAVVAGSYTAKSTDIVSYSFTRAVSFSLYQRDTMIGVVLPSSITITAVCR